MRPRDGFLLELGAIALLAASVRLPGLGDAPLWVDEVYTVREALAVARLGPERAVAQVGSGLSSYFLLLAPWIDARTPEWAVRLPSALFGVLLAVLLALLGREIGGIRAARAAGVAAALSPYLVWHAREARWYPLTWSLAAIAAIACVRAARRGGAPSTLICLGAGLAAASTYTPAIVLLPIEIAWILAARRRRAGPAAVPPRAAPRLARGALLAGIALCLAAAALWSWRSLVAPAWRGGSRAYGFHNLGGPRPGAIAYTAVAFATGYTVGPGPSEWRDRRAPRPLESALLFAGATAFLALAACGTRRLARLERMTAAFFAALATLPIGAIVLAALWTGHSFAPRYAGVSFLFALCLAAAALRAPARRASGAWAAAALLLALQGLALAQLHFNPRYRREDVRAAARHVAAHASKDARVMIAGGIEVPWRHYYRGAAPWAKAGDDDPGGARAVLAPSCRPRQIWTIRGRLWEEPALAEFLRHLDAVHPPGERLPFDGGLEVTRHDIPAGDGSTPAGSASYRGGRGRVG